MAAMAAVHLKLAANSFHPFREAQEGFG